MSPSNFFCLIELASSFRSRFQHLGDVVDIDEAIMASGFIANSQPRILESNAAFLFGLNVWANLNNGITAQQGSC